MTKKQQQKLVKKVELYEGVKKLLIEILVEVITGVVSKLISGGKAGLQREPELA
jgi:hypothetical protein